MKLLYLHQYYKFPDENGGTRSHDLATSFARNGYNVTVISSFDKEGASKWTYFEKAGIEYYFLNCPYNNKMTFYQRALAFVRFMFHSSVKSLQIKADVVLATSTPLTIAIPALIKKLFHKTSFVFEVRDVWPEVPIKMGYLNNKLINKLLYKFEYLTYKNASMVVPLSVGMEANIISRYSDIQTVVIPNISELKRFQDCSFLCNQDKIILYAGTFGHVNGLKYLIDLASKVLEYDKTIFFHIYGKGREEDELKAYAKDKGILDMNLFFKGSVSKRELSKVYSSALLGSSFVIDLPILWDNSANKFFDTLAAKRPILINHEGWQADEIRKSNIGYVLPAVLDDLAVNSFVEYVNNRDILKTQSENAYSVAKSKYALEVAVGKYVNIFESIKACHV